MIRRFFMLFLFKYFLGQRFRWYRRWHGGRWERWWIDICASAIWLNVDPARCWPQYRQPCGYGTPAVEDYPVRSPRT